MQNNSAGSIIFNIFSTIPLLWIYVVNFNTGMDLTLVVEVYV
jgi:hypothetical protein